MPSSISGGKRRGREGGFFRLKALYEPVKEVLIKDGNGGGGQSRTKVAFCPVWPKERGWISPEAERSGDWLADQAAGKRASSSTDSVIRGFCGDPRRSRGSTTAGQGDESIILCVVPRCRSCVQVRRFGPDITMRSEDSAFASAKISS